MEHCNYLCLWVNFRLVTYKDLGNRDLVFLGSKVHWSEKVLGSTVDVGSALQQKLSNIRVTFLSCEMQWCVAILQHTQTVAISTSYICNDVFILTGVL